MDPKQAVTLVLQIALILMVASAGLRANWHDVVATLGRPVGLVRAIIAVNVVVPLVAVLMCMALPISPGIKFAIVMMAVSPLAPVLPAKLLKEGSDASRVIGLYALMIALAVAIIPATILLLNSIFALELRTPVSAIAKLVAMSVILPLALGMGVAALSPKLAERIAGPANVIGSFLLAGAFILIVLSQGSGILKLIGDGAVLAMAVTVTAAIVGGHLLGGPNVMQRKSLAIAAAARHPGIAAVIVKANYDDKGILLTLMLFVVTSVVVTACYEYWLKRGDRAVAAGTAAA